MSDRSNESVAVDASVESGPWATDRLLPLVYDELRRLAAARLSREAPGITLQPTALVHEVYLRLVGSDLETPWDGRGHFFAAAAEAMRRILVDQARRKRALKRGGGLDRLDVDPDRIAIPLAETAEDLLALDEALERLALRHPDKAELVKLRYFAGLTGDQAAKALGISTATAERHWAYARAWLRVEVDGDRSSAAIGN
ncbi:MAG: sigma-70 family RNA polymerase sigma factor [Isosphaeraceae bacterium]